MPEFTAALVTAAAPVIPVIVVAPLTALKVKAETADVPPLSLVTVFTSVSFGAMSASLIVQVGLSPATNTRLLPVSVPAEQLHAPAL